MMLRDHPELTPWPNLKAIKADPPLAKPQDAERLWIKEIVVSAPARVHIILDYGKGACVFTKDFKDSKVVVAISNNKAKLRGRTFLDAGSIELG